LVLGPALPSTARGRAIGAFPCLVHDAERLGPIREESTEGASQGLRAIIAGLIEGSVQGSMIGVGSALRKARERRGITLEAASRDTKLRVDHLRALESEDFDTLLGDVYVRGSLRTYACYLGLSADKVIRAYSRHAEDPAPPPPPAKLGRVERAIAATRVRDNQLLMILLAGTVLVIAIVFGFLSRGYSTPPPATLPTVAAEAVPIDRQVDVVVRAIADVRVTVIADGIRSAFSMGAGETRTFTAGTTLVLGVTDGGGVRVSVNGRDLGIPGAPGLAWSKTFSFEGDAPLTPSPAP